MNSPGQVANALDARLAVPRQDLADDYMSLHVKQRGWLAVVEVALLPVSPSVLLL